MQHFDRSFDRSAPFRGKLDSYTAIRYRQVRAGSRMFGARALWQLSLAATSSNQRTHTLRSSNTFILTLPLLLNSNKLDKEKNQT
jgi:hypothetical protein